MSVHINMSFNRSEVRLEKEDGETISTDCHLQDSGMNVLTETVSFREAISFFKFSASFAILKFSAWIFASCVSISEARAYALARA
jgi:hypothetical protein